MPKSPLGARKDGRFKAVSTAPSFNKTPVGSATPPLPYPTIQDLGNSIGTTPSVRLNGDPAYVLDRSTQPSCKGDDPGTAGGVRSGTVNGEVKPVRGSRTVRFEGRPVVRVGDPCTMNGGNNPGVYVVQPEPLAIPPRAAASTEVPLTPPEPGWLERAARHYKELVSPSLHDAAGDALEKGVTLMAGGRAVTAVGGAIAATGVGAAPGAVVAGAGGAAAGAGGVLSATGVLTEGAAAAVDHAADYILSGQRPELLNAAMTLAQHLVLDRLTRFIPGAKAQPALKGRAPLARDKKPGLESPPPQVPPPLGGSSSDGVGIAGSGGRGSCRVGPYSKLRGTCPAGQQAHHIVPDTLNRTSSRAQGAKGIGRIPGMPTFENGPAICLTGHAGVQASEHNTAHQAQRDIQELALRTDNGPVGTLPVRQAIPKVMSATIAARPDCKEQIEAAVRKAYPDHESDNRSMNGAGRPAAGGAKAHLDEGGTADGGNRRNRPSRKR